MKCPKCAREVSDHDVLCPDCGAELFIDTTLADKLFSRNDESFQEPESDPPEPKKRLRLPKNNGAKLDFNKVKFIIIALCAVILVVLLVLIISSVVSSKGEKIAKQASDFIGADMDVAEKKIDAKFKKETAYKGLSNVTKFDLIAESEDDVRIDGVTYPEWAVIVSLDDENRITEVRYIDMESIKKDIRGEKKDKLINLDKFTKGSSRSSVEDEIDLDTYSIAYNKEGEARIYRYWYVNDNGDEQPVVMTVQFDSDGEYVSYFEMPVYHQYM